MKRIVITFFTSFVFVLMSYGAYDCIAQVNGPWQQDECYHYFTPAIYGTFLLYAEVEGQACPSVAVYHEGGMMKGFWLAGVDGQNEREETYTGYVDFLKARVVSYDTRVNQQASMAAIFW